MASVVSTIVSLDDLPEATAPCLEELAARTRLRLRVLPGATTVERVSLPRGRAPIGRVLEAVARALGTAWTLEGPLVTFHPKGSAPDPLAADSSRSSERMLWAWKARVLGASPGAVHEAPRAVAIRSLLDAGDPGVAVLLDCLELAAVDTATSAGAGVGDLARALAGVSARLQDTDRARLVKAFQAALESPEPRARAAGAAGLGDLAHVPSLDRSVGASLDRSVGASLDRLVAHARDVQEPEDVRLAAIAAVGSFGDAGETPLGVLLIEERSSPLLVEVAHALARTSESSLTPVAKAARSDLPATRAAAALALEAPWSRTDRARGLLAQLAQDPDLEVAAAATGVLARTGGDLRPFVRDPRPKRRALAVSLLDGHRPEEYSLATAALTDAVVDVRLRALGAIAAVGTDAVGDLVAALGDSNATVKIAACAALGRIAAAPELAAPMLVTLLRDPDADVAQAASDALGAYGPRQARVLPALEAAAGVDQPPAIRAVALHDLGLAGSVAASSLPLILSATRATDPAVALEAAVAAARVAGTSVAARAPLVALFTQTDPEVWSPVLLAGVLESSLGPEERARVAPRLAQILSRANPTRSESLVAFITRWDDLAVAVARVLAGSDSRSAEKFGFFRHEGLAALGSVAIAPLVDYVRAHPTDEKTLATLGSLTPTSRDVAPITSLLGVTGSPRVLACAAALLEHAGVDVRLEVRDALLPVLELGDTAARSAAARALGALPLETLAAMAPTVVTRLRLETDSNVRFALAVALARVAAPEARVVLRDAVGGHASWNEPGAPLGRARVLLVGLLAHYPEEHAALVTFATERVRHPSGEDAVESAVAESVAALRELRDQLDVVDEADLRRLCDVALGPSR